MEFGGVEIDNDTEFPIHMFQIPRCYRDSLSAVLIPQGLIQDRIEQLAREIHAKIGDRPLLMLCVLKGSYRFFTQLVQALSDVRHQCQSAIQVEFIRAQSYRNQASTGKLQIDGLAALQRELPGKQVLLVDDIMDTGLTLCQLVGELNKRIVQQQQQPAVNNDRNGGFGAEGSGESGEKNNNCAMARVWTAVLCSKRTALRRHGETMNGAGGTANGAIICREADFVAFNIPDKFIVGFGMDYNQAFRDLAHICVMSAHGVEKYKSVEGNNGTRTSSSSSQENGTMEDGMK